MIEPTKMWVEVDPETEDTVTFYSREIGSDRVCIIPKETQYQRFTLTETPTTYVITITNQDL